MTADRPLSLATARSAACRLFECVTGSRVYGTGTPESDLALRGVFAKAQEKIARIDALFAASDLRKATDRAALESALVDIRERWYLSA